MESLSGEVLCQVTLFNTATLTPLLHNIYSDFVQFSSVQFILPFQLYVYIYIYKYPNDKI